MLVVVLVYCLRWQLLKLEAYSLVQDFAVQSLLLHVGLPRPSVLLVGEGNGVAKPAPGQKRRGEDTEDQERVETAAAAYYGNTVLHSRAKYRVHR